MPAQLDPQAARDDLTDRECAKLLGATIGGLMLMAGENEVRRAVRWWAELSDEQWAQVVSEGARYSGTFGPRTR